MGWFARRTCRKKALEHMRIHTDADSLINDLQRDGFDINTIKEVLPGAVKCHFDIEIKKAEELGYEDSVPHFKEKKNKVLEKLARFLD